MKSIKNILLFVCTTLIVSCAGLHYSEVAMQHDNKVKSEAMALLAKSNENYSSHATEVETLKADVLQAYEEEKKRKGNNVSVAMWNEVINSKGNLFDVLNLWKNNGKLSKSMAGESMKQVERLLNSIADLEDHKKK